MSSKNLDQHGRWRSKTIAFRISEEENAQIDLAVQLSGLTKQDYISAKLLDRTIVVQGNCKVHRTVYDQLTSVLSELQRINTGEAIDSELQASITFIADLISRLYVPTPE